MSRPEYKHGSDKSESHEAKTQHVKKNISKTIKKKGAISDSTKKLKELFTKHRATITKEYKDFSQFCIKMQDEAEFEKFLQALREADHTYKQTATEYLSALLATGYNAFTATSIPGFLIGTAFYSATSYFALHGSNRALNGYRLYQERQRQEFEAKNQSTAARFFSALFS